MILFDTLNIFQPAYPVDMCFFFVVPAAKSASERKIFLWTGKSTTDPSEQDGTPKIRQHRCGIYRYIYSNIKIYTTFLKPKANSCRFPKYTVLAVYIYICLTCIYRKLVLLFCLISLHIFWRQWLFHRQHSAATLRQNHQLSRSDICCKYTPHWNLAVLIYA